MPVTTAPTPPTASPAPAPAASAPPLPWLLAYRVLGLRLPEEYRPWVARDVAGKHFLTWRMGRTFVWGLALIGLYYVAQAAVYEAPDRRMLVRLALVALAAALLASGKTLVRRTLRWQRVDKRGNPSAPKGLAVLDNQQALVLAVAVLVLFTGASAMFGFIRRPTGIGGARCRDADATSLRIIRGGLKDQSTELKSAKQLKFGDRRVVSAMAEGTEGPARIWIWVINGTQVYELRSALESENSPTTFPPIPTNRVDRALGPAVQTLVECLSDR